MSKKKKKLKLRVDRVMIAAVVVLALLFGIYKSVSYVGGKILSFLNSTPHSVVEAKTEKKYRATVVLDPGHGGLDVGANSGKLYEKNISLTTVKAIGEALEKENIKPVYTRTTDEALHEDKTTDLNMRAQMSLDHSATYFVSIHVNDFDKSNDVTGFEVYTKDKESETLANTISQQIEKLNYSQNRGLQDGSSLVVLKNNTVPSVLVELGYINGPDYKYLNDEAKLQQIGEAISKGIIELIK
ncbi:N-acetylmuramoyl-L-alanine amidase family protein [Candidatus Stoquefichus massiliensis]|uniref:N-acetylmuramoyl-L-alanine amidase family protein n=1 Tax=Candidatus Stoquefichus massiliensis TaxID=1470350 RepID=UPI0004AE446E|nr:N-acetylmuramoyl-L-alanine amidase [Candidatus Stoquefichus massiliensis]